MRREIVRQEEKAEYNPCKELMCAVILQAVRDLDSTNDKVRQDAEWWLLSPTSFLPEGLGKKIVEEHKNGKRRYKNQKRHRPKV